MIPGKLVWWICVVFRFILTPVPVTTSTHSLISDVKEIELIVQAPDTHMNGAEEETTTTKREVVITKGGEYQS